MITELPNDFPELCRKAGLDVIEIDGWQTRRRPASSGTLGAVGVLNHHTGAFDRIGDLADDLTYAKWMFLTGRVDLPAPLVQLALSAEGTVYVGAAGRANHAGTSKASGSVAAGDGNRLYIGIEWMLSGTQPIPEKMYEAAATLNAVLLRVLGSSVQAVSCHYQTSVTGKWDIGDPNGINFGTAKVLNVPKFRFAVQKEKDRLAGPPKRDVVKVSFQHTSMQFSDTDKQMASDVEKIFSQGKDIYTGTEAGGEKSKPLPDLLRAACKKYGYKFHIGRGDWLAVSEKLIKGGWEADYIPVLESFEGAGKHTDRGIPWATFEAKKGLGRITVGCGHYLTNGRQPGDPNFVLNRRYADAIGRWARDKGRGKDIVFYGGDQNIVDRTEDTFFGSPLTSAWDELDKYENTGHGNIDVIASYDGDGRVSAKSIKALDDKEMHLHTDHFAVQAVYEVRQLD
jgi:hypothetical protein